MAEALRPRTPASRHDQEIHPSHLALFFAQFQPHSISSATVRAAASSHLQIQRYPSIAYRMTRPLRCSSLSSLKDPCATASDLRNRGLSNSWPAARDYPCVILLFLASCSCSRRLLPLMPGSAMETKGLVGYGCRSRPLFTAAQRGV
jgi:hypothetical protein